MAQDNDASYKLLFSSPELALGFIPDARGLYPAAGGTPLGICCPCGHTPLSYAPV